MNEVEVCCDECCEISVTQTLEKVKKGDTVNTYCAICDDHTEQTVTDIID